MKNNELYTAHNLLISDDELKYIRGKYRPGAQLDPSYLSSDPEHAWVSRQFATGEQLKHRKLILTDNTLDLVSSTYEDTLIIQQLLDDGFEIYIPSNEGLIQLSINTPIEINCEKLVLPIDITAILAELDCEIDSVAFLSTPVVSALRDNSTETILDLSRFYYLEDAFLKQMEHIAFLNKHALIKIPEKLMLSYKEHLRWIDNHPLYFDCIKTICLTGNKDTPDINVIETLSTLSLKFSTADFEIALFKLNDKLIEDLDENKLLGKIKKIKVIEIHIENSDALSKILNIQNLTSFSYDSGFFLNEFEPISLDDIAANNSLQSLTLDSAVMSLDNLEKLPNLRELNLRVDDETICYLEKISKHKNGKLNSLEIHVLPGECIDNRVPYDIFANLLENNKNLKSLDMSLILEINEEVIKTEYSNEFGLEKLKIENIELNIIGNESCNFLPALKKMPHLKYCSFPSDQINTSHYIEFHPEARLEDLQFFSSLPILEFDEKTKRNLSEIKKVSLFHMNNDDTNEIHAKAKEFLSHCTNASTICLSAIAIQYNELAQLLNKMRRLQNLSLTDVLSPEKTNVNFNLMNLRKLKLALFSLNFDDYEILLESFFLDLISDAKHLEFIALDLMDNYRSAFDFNYIIKAMPLFSSLRYMHLNIVFEAPSKKTETEVNDLINLKELFFHWRTDSTQIPLEVLSFFFKHAVNLKSFMDRCHQGSNDSDTQDRPSTLIPEESWQNLQKCEITNAPYYWAEDILNILLNANSLFELTLNGNAIFNPLSLSLIPKLPGNHFKKMLNLTVKSSNPIAEKWCDLIKRSCSKNVTYSYAHTVQKNKIATQKNIPYHLSIDSKTFTDPNKTLQAYNYFNGDETRHPSTYRISIYDQLDINDKGDIKLSTSTGNVTEQLPKKTSEYTAFKNTSLPIKADGEWHVLVTLNSFDRIENINCDFPYDIRYNNNTQQYEILIKPCEEIFDMVNVSYRCCQKSFDGNTSEADANYVKNTRQFYQALVDCLEKGDDFFAKFKKFIALAEKTIGNIFSDKKSKEDNVEWHKLNTENRIALLIIYFARFKNQMLSKDKMMNDYETLKTICFEAKGSCRHRAIAFKYLASYLLPEVATQIVTNDIHAYIEIKYQSNFFLMIQLGGARTKLETTLYKEPINYYQQYCDLENNNKIEILDTEESDVVRSDTAPTKAASIREGSRFAKWIFKTLDLTESFESLYYALNKLPKKKRNCLFAIKKEKDFIHLHRRVTERFATLALNNLDELTLVNYISDANGVLNAVNSELGHFLFERNDNNLRVLLININDLKSYHTSLNCLMNGKREIQNTKIPNNIIVLLTCSELKAKQLGSDYHSRIHKVYQATAPLTSDVVTLLKPPKPRSTIFEYIFYEHWNWKSQLITSLSLDNNLNFYNRLGIFNQVINAQCSGIHLINPPKDPAFVIWLNQILNNRYYFNNGNYINLPDEFSITCETKDITFDKKVISYNIKHGEIPACDFVLNTQTIFELDNFLTQHHLTTLRLWINQPLSNGVWILLMEKLQKRDITFILSPNVTIPNEIVTNIQPTDAVELPKVINEKIQLIKTNDIYFSLMKLEKNHSLSFPITDKTSIQDLTYRLRFDRENMSIKKIDSAFSEAIKNGQDIILYGDFSEEIQQYLYCLYVNSTAKITIITDNDKALSQMPNQIELCNFNSRCSMVFGDGYQQLRKIAFKLQQALNLEFSTSQLIAIKDNLDKHPNKNPFYPILRICPEYRRHYKAVAKQIFPTHKINNRSDVDFMSKRENKFKAGLIEKPFTFIIGESGVGKSTFVLEYFEKNDASLFCGEENLLAWLLSPHDKGLQVLFIDEANLSDAHHWDFLDTLVETSPFVIWQGTRYNLSQNHKVVFTGNYSDFKDRSVMHLAERHGNVIEFKPFSRAYLLSHIGTMLNQYLKDVLLIFLLKFGILDQYLKHKENLGLTIRDLNEKIFSIAQMLIAIEKDTNKTIDFSNQVMFNENYNIFKENFNGDTNTIQHDLLKNLEKLGMVITDNWIEPLKVLSKWITQLTNTGHGVQKQGIILEGEPGIGKSLCAELILKAHGYLEGIVTGANNNMYSNSYYKVTVNNIALLEVVLKKVFHEGAVDILDEINTAPLEGLLNQYLTGRDPQGNLAKKPGFGIIGTQNGVNFSGRRQGSHAWKNRFTTIKIAEYNESDLMKVYQFYQNKYLTKYQVMLTDELETKLLNLSHQYIDEYREAIIYGKENHCSPLPCARDVIDAIKIKIKKTIIDFNNINTVTMRSGENSFLGKRTASDCEKPKKIHHSEKTSSGCFGLKPLNR